MTRNRSRHHGANLLILAGVATMLIGFMGVSIYLGLQAYITSELQKAASTAAMVGASNYYSNQSATGKPVQNAVRAEGLARDTFRDIVESSKALKGFGAVIKGVTTNSGNDSVTLSTEGNLPTPFLAPVGIKQISVVAHGTAKALRYEPTMFVGPVSMMPDGTMPSMQRTIKLAFPLVDVAGNDLYVEQSAQSPYVVEACNDSDCYDLVKGATNIGSGKTISSGGSRLLIGSAFIDLNKAGVNKATKLRFTHGNRFDTYYAGKGHSIPLYPTAVTLDRVFIFGFAGNCPDANNCPVPVGFAPME